MAPLRCVYCDLDGTLLGRGASFLHDADGSFSLLGARALEACARAGRRVRHLLRAAGARRCCRDARMLGVRSYVFEAGAGVVLDGEVHWLTGASEPRDGRNVREQIEASGAPGAAARALSPGGSSTSTRGMRDREVSYLLRGEVDAAEADALLAEHGLADLRLLDNGAIASARRRCRGSSARAPTTCSRATPRRRAASRSTCARAATRPRSASRSATRARTSAPPEVVAAFWLVANGARRGDPSRRGRRRYGGASAKRPRVAERRATARGRLRGACISRARRERRGR